MFKVGDIVKLKEGIYRYPILNDYLLKVHIVKNSLGVEVLNGVLDDGHKLNGYINNNNGWWIDSDLVELVKSSKMSKDNNFCRIVITTKNEFKTLVTAFILKLKDKEVAVYWQDGIKKIVSNPSIISSYSDKLPIGINIKINSSEISDSIMPGKRKRAALLGQVFTLFEEYPKTTKDKQYTIYRLKTQDDIISFASEDCEVILPTLQGYNPPKDRSFQKGYIVKYKYKGNPIYSIKERFEILRVIERNDDHKIILELKNESGKIIKEYGNKFKVV